MRTGTLAKHLTALMLAVAITATIAPQTATAEGTQAEAQILAPARTIQRTSRAPNNSFDWLVKTRTTAPPPVTIQRQIGNGSYICAPAGFGRKSRCYSN